MKKWLNKLVVVVVAIMTLGLYIPPIPFTPNADENKANVSAKSTETGHEQQVVSETFDDEIVSADVAIKEQVHSELLIDEMTESAKAQTLTKLGPRIANEITDEVTTEILPEMEEVIRTILLELDEDEVAYYGITEKPTDGYGEKIFNIYDYRTKEDVALFHVRRDNRPLDGYWFNFHYHLNSDNFEKHHEIGNIYWDKNIPPKWMGS